MKQSAREVLADGLHPTPESLRSDPRWAQLNPMLQTCVGQAIEAVRASSAADLPRRAYDLRELQTIPRYAAMAGYRETARDNLVNGLRAGDPNAERLLRIAIAQGEARASYQSHELPFSTLRAGDPILLSQELTTAMDLVRDSFESADQLQASA